MAKGNVLRFGAIGALAILVMLGAGCAAERAPFSDESAALVAYYEPRRAADQAHVDALHAARAGDTAALTAWREAVAGPQGDATAFNAAHKGKVSLREEGPWAVYAPAGKPKATLVYLHGGGWAVGGPRTNEAFCAALAEKAAVEVWSLDYPLAPENAFPVAPRVVSDHVKALRARFADRPLFISGDSAGGNLAIVAALVAPGVADGLILYYPVLALYPDGTPEYRAYQDVILLTASLTEAFARVYVDAATARSNPIASPLLAGDAALCTLPPILTVAAECDLLAGQSRLLHERLATLGRAEDARFLVTGALHGFLSFPQLPASQRVALDVSVRWLRARLAHANIR